MLLDEPWGAGVPPSCHPRAGCRAARLPAEGPVGPGVPQTRAPRRSLSFAGLRRQGCEPALSHLELARRGQLSGMFPWEFVWKGAFCLQSRHTLGAEGRSRVNLVLRGKQARCHGLLRPGPFPLPGGLPGSGVGGGNAPPGSPGARPCFASQAQTDLRLQREARFLCLRPGVVQLQVRQRRRAPGRGSAPAGSCRAGCSGRGLAPGPPRRGAELPPRVSGEP